jgi:hypothetical protein
VNCGVRGFSWMPRAATSRPFFQRRGSTFVTLVGALSRSLSAPVPPVPGTGDAPLPPALPRSPGASVRAPSAGRSVLATPPPSFAAGGWFGGGGSVGPRSGTGFSSGVGGGFGSGISSVGRAGVDASRLFPRSAERRWHR